MAIILIKQIKLFNYLPQNNLHYEEHHDIKHETNSRNICSYYKDYKNCQGKIFKMSFKNSFGSNHANFEKFLRCQRQFS